MRLPIARDGHLHIAIAIGVTLALFVLGVPVLPWLALGVTLLVLNFFRDPERVGPSDPDLAVAPADGKVIKVVDIDDDRFLHGPAKLICIFMSPLDVHVNRVPADAEVVDVIYKEGGFLRAWADAASLDNEQNAIVAQRPDGRRFCFVQISGFLARRIVSHLRPGMQIHRAERFGMIKFGSRLDVYLPVDTEILVGVGDRTRAGETPIARWG